MSSVDIVLVSPSADRDSDSLANGKLTLNERFHAGEPSALEEVVREFGAAIADRLQWKYKQLLARDRAEHVAQAAIFRTWERRGDYDPRQAPLAA